MAKKKTVGAISSELLVKADNNHTVIDQTNEQLSEWEASLFETIEKTKKAWPNKDFFVVVITKQERLMPNVFRNYFFTRFSCPTPDYDQTLYKYNFRDDIVDFVWVIPSRDTCMHLKENALLVVPEERGLLEYVLLFADGSLAKLCNKLNGEAV